MAAQLPRRSLVVFFTAVVLPILLGDDEPLLAVAGARIEESEQNLAVRRARHALDRTALIQFEEHGLSSKSGYGRLGAKGRRLIVSFLRGQLLAGTLEHLMDFATGPAMGVENRVFSSTDLPGGYFQIVSRQIPLHMPRQSVVAHPRGYDFAFGPTECFAPFIEGCVYKRLDKRMPRRNLDQFIVKKNVGSRPVVKTSRPAPSYIFQRLRMGLFELRERYSPGHLGAERIGLDEARRIGGASVTTRHHSAEEGQT